MYKLIDLNILLFEFVIHVVVFLAGLLCIFVESLGLVFLLGEFLNEVFIFNFVDAHIFPVLIDFFVAVLESFLESENLLPIFL